MSTNKQLYKGLFWSAIDKFSIAGIQMVLEILMARILIPQDYGLMGMLLVVMSFTKIFIDCGLGNALIFKKNRTDTDFATAFYASAILGVILYLILLISAPYVSTFYNHDITFYVRVMGVVIIFNSLSAIYKARLTISMDFKSQAKFSIIAVVSSGLLGLGIAYLGYGIWALIIQNLTFAFFNLLFMSINLKWIPKYRFSKQSFFELYNYSSKLLYAAILNTIYINFNSVILGKFYSVKSLGYYTKSYQFTIFPISMLTDVVQRVFFPYLTNFQENKSLLFQHNNYYNKLILVILLPIFTLVILFSESLIGLILSEQWLGMVEPFNILLTAMLFYPLIVMNMNIFQVIGKTSKFLFVEILTKITGIIILFFCYKHGLIGLCIGLLIQFMIQYIITSFFVSRVLKSNFFKSFEVFIYIAYAILIYLAVNYMLKSDLFGVFFIKVIMAVVFVIILYFLLYFVLYKNEISKLYEKIVKN